MPVNIREFAFETAIEHSLLERGGYGRLPADSFDRKRALFPSEAIEFIRETQPKAWQALEKLNGANTERVILDDMVKALESFGPLHVLRRGFKCFGKQVDLAYFRPAHNLNPDTEALYRANRLGVSRQVYFSASNEKSLDVVLALNGIPIVTLELKNPLTGQRIEHAKTQYRTDRDPREPIFAFKKRSLVHFAVDPDEIAMTTKLLGKETLFLPFNKGAGGGAGNPPNPTGFKTDYLWDEVLIRESLLDIVARFVHVEKKEVKTAKGTFEKESLIFPRYHQLDAVRKLEADARANGAGKNYLIQHSAGSGKSNSIAWLAHRLASLHNASDEKVFGSVIVVTDRVVLDRQLQDAIYQFDHTQGVVTKIDKHSDQLAEALKSGTPIIVTTLQKFPFVTEKVGSLPGKRFAVIVDEAHSSQSGEAAAELKGVLAGDIIRDAAKKQAEEEGLPDHEEEIVRTMLRRGQQANLSFFAFTATPKHKTIATFGQPGPDGIPQPFHVYTMRQAIDEGFILDVLRNYTTYKTYYRLLKAIQDDPRVEKRKAAKALARFMSFHPHNIAQKTEVIIEHFRAVTQHKIGGRAKAMVVTSSRLHAVRYKLAFDEYITTKGYSDLKALVAFSGEVEDPDIPGKTYTEVEMNGGIREKELPERFTTDEYRVLIVAEKYQTGFDQPLLHTMYVDKRLDGVQAVQTLSRLNRTAQGKEDTFVLDFVNDAADIQAAFAPYYEASAIGDQADPQQLYELQTKLADTHIYHATEVDELAATFFKPKERQSISDLARINACIDPAVTRFEALDSSAQEEFRSNVAAFRNLYSFLSQVMPFQDADLEKLYTYLRFLSAKLPRRNGPIYDFDGDVQLKYYRLQKISEGSIALTSGESEPLKGPTAVGSRSAEDEEVELSRLIDVLNERFGTTFTPADELFFEQIREDATNDEALREAAQVNSLDNFKFVFDKTLENLFIDRMEQNEDLFARYMNNPDFQKLVAQMLGKQVYDRIRTPAAELKD
ncbi:MAG: type restriction enzyme subunit [Thermoanaerobaculia bacterium]|jgi:type I restriction enzyme R subunit|nr:type restriction enzyme subunit [Thermoanaerobaculia bacterium]